MAFRSSNGEPMASLFTLPVFTRSRLQSPDASLRLDRTSRPTKAEPKPVESWNSLNVKIEIESNHCSQGLANACKAYQMFLSLTEILNNFFNYKNVFKC